jgi:group I intron endonuclease
MERRSFVYRHRRFDTNEIFYIGKGSTLKRFLKSKSEKKRFKRAFSTENRNNWWNSIAKQGFIVEILSSGLTDEEACDLEMFLISEYGRKDCCGGILVNLTDGGEGNNGYTMSEKQKEDIRERNSGKNSYWFGKFGKLHPMYGKVGELNPYYGKTHNEEIRAKMKKPHLKNRGENHPKSKIILNTETGVFYMSIKEASESCELKYNTLKNILNGSHKINNTYFIKI